MEPHVELWNAPHRDVKITVVRVFKAIGCREENCHESHYWRKCRNYAPPKVWGGAEKGSKSAGRVGAGAGNILRVLIEIICCSKEISICIALSEVNLLNIHNLDRNHN